MAQGLPAEDEISSGKFCVEFDLARERKKTKELLNGCQQEKMLSDRTGPWLLRYR